MRGYDVDPTELSTAAGAVTGAARAAVRPWITRATPTARERLVVGVSSVPRLAVRA